MNAHWKPVYVGLGSNLDNPVKQVESALGKLAAIPRTRLIRQSSLWRSEPFGGVEQPEFVNAAASLLTSLEPLGLLLELQRIENESGRNRDEVRWGPRILDLDLLVYAGQTIDLPELQVPHPGIAERNFVLLPLKEIAPLISIPGLGLLRNISTEACATGISRIG